MVLLEFLNFLFFRRQGFRMMTFDRAGPFQNFNRSQVMHGHRKKCIVFRPARPPGEGAPNTPKSPPPPNVCVRFRTPGTFLKKNIVGKQKNHFYCVCVLRPRNIFLRPRHPHAPAQPSEHSPQSSCNNK